MYEQRFLEQHNITTLEDLARISVRSIFQARGLGVGAFHKFNKILNRAGLSLNMKEYSLLPSRLRQACDRVLKYNSPRYEFLKNVHFASNLLCDNFNIHKKPPTEL